MEQVSSKVTLHMVASLDGFIAKKDGDMSWFESPDHYEKGTDLSDDDVQKFLDGIDCYVMGSHTYELALKLGWPYGNKPVIVLTSRTLQSDKPEVEFRSGDVVELVNDLKTRYSNIWMVGGADLTKQFLRLDLVDEIVMSIMPIVLGDGVLFFDYIGRELRLRLKDMMAFKNGMVELTYEVPKMI